MTPLRLLPILLAAALLGGCTVFPVEDTAGTSEASATSDSDTSAAGKSARGASKSDSRSSSDSSGGGYYLDDGPRENLSPAQLAAIPDAVVKPEKIRAAHNRPYTVLNKRYKPFSQLTPYRKRGIASWYGKRYHGRQTAMGEIYDMHKMTAAHPILPIPSYARVTRISSGDSVVVRINDRGPFLQGREIDLSYVAAAKLGIIRAGTGEVIVESIVPGQAAGGAAESGGRIQEVQAVSGDVYIQLAVFSSRQAAERSRATIAATLPAVFQSKLIVHKKQSGALYAVQVGPYKDHATATKDDNYLCQHHQQCGFLTKRY